MYLLNSKNREHKLFIITQKTERYQMFKNIIKKHFIDTIKIKEKLLRDTAILNNISEVCKIFINTFTTGGKIIIAGNGGSAADAQHIAGEFVGRFYFDRPGLPSMALTTDTSILTAIGNDYGFQKIFSRQLKTYGVKGDIFLGISTSGNSKNIIEALNTSKDMNIHTVGLTGNEGGCMKELCDICIIVPSSDTPRIQECHILIAHAICAIVEQEIYRG